MKRGTSVKNARKGKYKNRSATLSIIRNGNFSDPRNFSSKHLKKSILKRLFALLEEHEVQHHFTVAKWLKETPLTKHVLFLFEFLFQLIDDNFELKMVKKSHKDVVDYLNVYRIISALGIHGKLRERDLQSLLPHSWNNCIFVFDLLIEIIRYVEKRGRNEQFSPQCLNPEIFEFYRSYLSIIYPKFLDGMNQAALDQKRRENLGDLEKQIQKFRNDCDNLELRKSNIQEKLTEYGSNMPDSNVLESERNELSTELRKLQNKIGECIEKNSKLNREADSESNQTLRIEGDIRQMEAVLSELRRQVPNPYASVSDGQRLKERCFSKEQEVSQKRIQLEALKKEIWEMEREAEKSERENKVCVGSLNSRVQSDLSKGVSGVDEEWMLRDDGDDLRYEIENLENRLIERVRSSSLSSVRSPEKKIDRMVDEGDSSDENDEEDDDDMEVDNSLGNITREIGRLNDLKKEYANEEREYFDLKNEFSKLLNQQRSESMEMKQILMNLYNMANKFYSDASRDISHVKNLVEEAKSQRSRNV